MDRAAGAAEAGLRLGVKYQGGGGAVSELQITTDTGPDLHPCCDQSLHPSNCKERLIKCSWLQRSIRVLDINLNQLPWWTMVTWIWLKIEIILHMDRMDQIGPAPQSNAGILTSHSCDANIYIFAPSSNSDVASCFWNAIKNLEHLDKTLHKSNKKWIHLTISRYLSASHSTIPDLFEVPKYFNI